MKINDVITIAFRNVRCNKKLSSKLIIALSFVLTMCVCCIVIISGYANYKTSFVKNHVSSSYYYLYKEDEELSSDFVKNLVNKSKTIQSKCKAVDIVELCTISGKKSDFSMTAGSTELVIDCKKYKVKSYDYNAGKQPGVIENRSSSINIGYYTSGMKIFPYYSPNRIYGNYPNKEGEIMLDTYLLKAYDINGDYQNLIGKKISVRNTSNQYVFKNYVISGVFEHDNVVQREKKNVINLHHEYFFANIRKRDSKRFLISSLDVRFFHNSFENFVNNYSKAMDLLTISKSRTNEDGLELSPSGYYCCLIYYFMNSVGKIMALVVIAIVFVTLASIMYLLYFYRNKQENYRQMLKCIGMKKSTDRKVFLMEILCILLAAICVCTYLSIIILRLVNYLTKLAFDFSLF